MSFEQAARAVVEADKGAQAQGQVLPLSAREKLFFNGLGPQGYAEGLAWLAHYAGHTQTCTKVHNVSLTPDTPLAHNLLKLVSYGYLRGLMERQFNLSLAYPEQDEVMFGPAGAELDIPAYNGNVETVLTANPLAWEHLLRLAQRVAQSGRQQVHAVSPKTEVARQLLTLLAGESLRAAVVGWLGAQVGRPLDGNWYGCCAPVLAPRGKLSLTFDEQLKYQTDPTVMC